MLRGFRNGNVLIAGAGAEDRDISDAMIVAAANLCEQQIASVDYSPGYSWTFDRYTGAYSTTPTSVNVNKYNAGMMVKSSDTLASSLVELQAAMDGAIIDRGGAITILPGASRTPVFNLTDADIMWTEERSWQPESTLSDLHNQVIGTFVDENAGYVEAAFPTLTNSTWEANDGGNRLPYQTAFRAVTNWAQVQLITQRIMAGTRYQGTIAFVLPLDLGLQLEQGDWFTFTSSRWNFATKYFVAMKVDITPELKIPVIGKEVAASFPGWAHTNEIARDPTVWNPPAYSLQNVTLTVTPYHQIDAASIVEVFGVTLGITNFPVQSGITVIDIEIALQTTLSNTSKLAALGPGNQTAKVVGLMPNTNYAIRCRTTDGFQFSSWSGWANFNSNSTESVLTTISPNADNTAANQLSIGIQQTVTLGASSAGVVNTAQLPFTLIPTVIAGSTDIRTSDSVTYSILNVSSSLTVSVNNTGGSASKGFLTFTAVSASGFLDYQVTVNGVGQLPIRIAINTTYAVPAISTSTSGSFSLTSGTWTSTTTATIGQISGIGVSSGQSLNAFASAAYAVLLTYSNPGSVIPYVKFQYSPAGAGSWTDMGSFISGSNATYVDNPHVTRETQGSFGISQTVTPSAGTYDVRLVAYVEVYTGAYGAAILSGTVSVNAS
jgi:hypothetical protein